MSHFPSTFHVHMPCPAKNLSQAEDRWEFEDSALDELNNLADDAPQAYHFLYAKLGIWARSGAVNVPTSILEAPVAKNLQVPVRTPPWIGEIKATEEGKTRKEKDRFFRLYFGDIKGQKGAPPHQMLVGLTSEKIIKLTTKKTNNAQNKQMIDAMYKIKQWCKKQGVNYRSRV